MERCAAAADLLGQQRRHFYTVDYEAIRRESSRRFRSLRADLPAVGHGARRRPIVGCYKLRVMLSHLRLKFDSRKDSSGVATPGIQKIFEVMQEAANAGPKKRRLAKEQCALINFRNRADSGDEQEEEAP